MQLYPSIVSYLQRAEKEMTAIPAERKALLGQLASFVKENAGPGRQCPLVFICTHNSRRSHTAQLWAATAAAYYGVQGIETYSGGTEVTAFNHSAVKALADAGFQIVAVGEEDANPVYEVRLGGGLPVIRSFSKKFTEPPNPQSDFAAIMTCASADQGCPLVPGAATRIAIPYNDPKASDGTPEQKEVYAARCREIAIEMLYVFFRAKKN